MDTAASPSDHRLMARNTCIALIAATLLASCVTSRVLYWPLIYQSSDDPSKAQLLMSFTNPEKKEVCLSDSNWPNSSGNLNQMGDTVWLEVDGRRFPIADVNTGYCTENCSIRVQPGQTVKASLPYENFGLPSNLFKRPKKLHFDAFAFSCA